MNEDIWKVYYYVCSRCDASIEITSRVSPERTPSCSCKARTRAQVILISINEAVKGKRK